MGFFFLYGDDPHFPKLIASEGWKIDFQFLREF